MISTLFGTKSRVNLSAFGFVGSILIKEPENIQMNDLLKNCEHEGRFYE